MKDIVLTDEQAKIVENGARDVRFVDGQGRLVGFFRPICFTAEEIAEAEKLLDSDGPWYTTKELLERVQARVGK